MMGSFEIHGVCVVQYLRQFYLSSLLDITNFFKLSGCLWNLFPAQDLEESEQMLHQAQAGGVPALRTERWKRVIEVGQRDGGRVLGESLGLNNEKNK